MTSKKTAVSKDDLKKALTMINQMKSLMTHENKIVNLKNLIVEKMQREGTVQGEHILEINKRLNALSEMFSLHCVSVQISIHRKINMPCVSRNLCMYHIC